MRRPGRFGIAKVGAVGQVDGVDLHHQLGVFDQPEGASQTHVHDIASGSAQAVGGRARSVPEGVVCRGGERRRIDELGRRKLRRG